MFLHFCARLFHSHWRNPPFFDDIFALCMLIFLHFCARPFHSHWRNPPCLRRLYCCSWDSLDTPEKMFDVKTTQKKCNQICLKYVFVFYLWEQIGREMKKKPPLINKDRRLGSWRGRDWHRRGRRQARGRRWPAQSSSCPPAPWWYLPCGGDNTGDGEVFVD